jgi:8-oxo-dGTP pyrophosphatase MutT (NUDIX family)
VIADSAEHIAYRNSRPSNRMGAGALIRDREGRVLVVEPTYKPTWELPGGAVEAHESPRQACRREVAEELGSDLQVGRLLCLEWQGPEPDRTESLMFVYDGGVLDASRIRLPADELSSYAFLSAHELDGLMSPRLARRTRAALRALGEGRLVELEHGVLVETVPPTSAPAS